MRKYPGQKPFHIIQQNLAVYQDEKALFKEEQEVHYFYEKLLRKREASIILEPQFVIYLAVYVYENPIPNTSCDVSVNNFRDCKIDLFLKMVALLPSNASKNVFLNYTLQIKLETIILNILNTFEINKVKPNSDCNSQLHYSNIIELLRSGKGIYFMGSLTFKREVWIHLGNRTSRLLRSKKPDFIDIFWSALANTFNLLYASFRMNITVMDENDEKQVTNNSLKNIEFKKFTVWQLSEWGSSTSGTVITEPHQLILEKPNMRFKEIETISNCECTREITLSYVFDIDCGGLKNTINELLPPGTYKKIYHFSWENKQNMVQTLQETVGLEISQILIEFDEIQSYNSDDEFKGCCAYEKEQQVLAIIEIFRMQFKKGENVKKVDINMNCDIISLDILLDLLESIKGCLIFISCSCNNETNKKNKAGCKNEAQCIERIMRSANIIFEHES